MTHATQGGCIYRTTSIILVSTYLFFVAIWLVVTRQIPAPGLKKILGAGLRRPYEGTLSDFHADEGHCWTAKVPEFLLSDKEASSALQLMEEGAPMGPAHSPHEDIRRYGSGRYSHWGPIVYFSSSDNSDPKTNGRRYSVLEKRS